MVASIYSIIPPLVALTLVLLTKRVIFSLGSGIVAAAILLAVEKAVSFGDMVKGTSSILYVTIKNIFWVNGSLNTGNLYILLFLMFLGMITALITMSGGSSAFADWAITRVKTRRSAQLLTALLGIMIFIDDYFNALAVGQIAKPITDRHQVSRAKLAYIIDSTAAPICVVSPISSWGAYIIALISTIFITNEITTFTAFTAFVLMIPLNFYVWSTLFLVFSSIAGNMNFGPMRDHEERAEQEAILHDPEKQAPGDLQEKFPVRDNGKVSDLVVPILALFIGTIGALFGTGYANSSGNANVLQIFEHTDVSLSLFIGGGIGLITAIGNLLWNRNKGEKLTGRELSLACKEGIKSMLSAIGILLFAWTFSALIGDLETGKYLAGLIHQLHVNSSWLPLLLFGIAAVMSFTTGSSWGSFGILLPIAGTIAATIDETVLLAAMAAVLACSVFGDHCSPISDTTILSATGAGCHHIDHVVTQIPYALVSAFSAAAGYFILGFSKSFWAGFMITLLVTFLFAKILTKKKIALTGKETGELL